MLHCNKYWERYLVKSRYQIFSTYPIFYDQNLIHLLCSLFRVTYFSFSSFICYLATYYTITKKWLIKSWDYPVYTLLLPVEIYHISITGLAAHTQTLFVRTKHGALDTPFPTFAGSAEEYHWQRMFFIYLLTSYNIFIWPDGNKDCGSGLLLFHNIAYFLGSQVQHCSSLTPSLHGCQWIISARIHILKYLSV